jgi:hypothetical protein
MYDKFALLAIPNFKEELAILSDEDSDKFVERMEKKCKKIREINPKFDEDRCLFGKTIRYCSGLYDKKDWKLFDDFIKQFYNYFPKKLFVKQFIRTELGLKKKTLLHFQQMIKM